jgi:hypothetical protein
LYSAAGWRWARITAALLKEPNARAFSPLLSLDRLSARSCALSWQEIPLGSG